MAKAKDAGSGTVRKVNQANFGAWDVVIGADDDGGSPLLMSRLAPESRSERDDRISADKADGNTTSDPLDGNPEEWRRLLYCLPEIGVYIPRDNIVACFRNSVSREKIDGANAKKVLAAGASYFDQELDYSLRIIGVPLLATKDFVRIRSIDDFKALCDTPDSGVSVDVRFVRDSGIARSPRRRYRPRFYPWRLAFRMQFDCNAISKKRLTKILEYAGQWEGLGDARPGCRKPYWFGKFRIVSLEPVNG